MVELFLITFPCRASLLVQAQVTLSNDKSLPVVALNSYAKHTGNDCLGLNELIGHSQTIHQSYNHLD